MGVALKVCEGLIVIPIRQVIRRSVEQLTAFLAGLSAASRLLDNMNQAHAGTDLTCHAHWPAHPTRFALRSVSAIRFHFHDRLFK